MEAGGGSATEKLELIMGRGGVERLAASAVMVLGLGGVGSNCVEALARGGVGRFVVLDRDVVQKSNINRQAIAFHSTLGRKKAEVVREMIADINPAAQVEALDRFLLAKDVPAFLGAYAGQVDYVVDAIDTVSAKLAIAQHCHRNSIPLISSMGTGNKLHPERFQVADLAETSVCPLCRVMRRELKKRGVEHLKVVYSQEKPVDMHGKLPEEEAGARRAVPGSVSFVPPAAGLIIAGEVIRELAGVE